MLYCTCMLIVTIYKQNQTKTSNKVVGQCGKSKINGIILTRNYGIIIFTFKIME